MKLKNIIVFSFLFSIQLSSQDYNLPVFGENIEMYYWDSKEDTIQIKYWPNGNIKVKYETINDNSKWRYDYNENGSIRFKLQIRQAFVTDTITLLNMETYEQTMRFKNGIRDIAEGSFTSYYYFYGSTEPVIKETGYYKEGYKTGEWIKIDFSFRENKIKANFKEGKLDGLYTSYYLKLTGFEDRVKYQGNYKPISLKLSEWNVESRQFDLAPRIEVRRTGTWYYYNELGDIVETIEYKRQ